MFFLFIQQSPIEPKAWSVPQGAFLDPFFPKGRPPLAFPDPLFWRAASSLAEGEELFSFFYKDAAQLASAVSKWAGETSSPSRKALFL